MDRQDRRVVRKKVRMKRKPRRRIRWKRVIVALAILAGILWGIGAACSWAYHVIFDLDETAVEEVVEQPAEEEPLPPPPVRSTPLWSTSAIHSSIAEEKLAASRKTINLLLIGADDNTDGTYYGQADSIVLVIANTEDNTASMISIPSNMRIPIAGSGAVTLKDIYQQGGTPLTLRLLEEYFGITIPYYATVDQAVFTRLVDELGGVELYVEQDMAYTDSYDGYVIDLKKGYQTLDGNMAGQYIRYIDGELGEVGRMKRQERFAKAMIAQHASLTTIFDIPSLLTILEDESDSNLTFYPLMKLVGVLRTYQPNMTLGELLPGHLASDASGVHWLVDQARVDALFKRIFKIEVPEEETATEQVSPPINLTKVTPTEQDKQTAVEQDKADTVLENQNEG